MGGILKIIRAIGVPTPRHTLCSHPSSLEGRCERNGPKADSPRSHRSVEFTPPLPSEKIEARAFPKADTSQRGGGGPASA